MSSDLDDYLPAKEAAEEIGISYGLLMARIYHGKIVFKKLGWATLIHKDEVATQKAKQQEMEQAKNAGNKDMEGTTG